ncbi:hypothetical protein L2D14_00515 [Thalassospiraceae bacterium LMO-JJ14]|nr:hypothetical protein L2D14_00515 [Thalassospiraceae bacterium LMO-JJ14]
MHEFIDCIFGVWCAAPGGAPYSLDLFNGNAELREVMDAFDVSDAYGADLFNGHVQQIYEIFATLTAGEIAQISSWYSGNNDLEAVCANDPTNQIARYADIKAMNEGLAELLGEFFKALYSERVLGLAALKEKIGDIKDHYKSFVAVNNEGKCPFCGLSDMKSENHEKREAYDHFLPQALYPFNTVNFRNLAPTCHECNTTYKLAKDPAIRNGVRRKSFYPYSAIPSGLEITITINSNDFQKISVDEIALEYGPVAKSEEIDTWRDLYSIDERYKAKCCGTNDGKYWIVQILDEWTIDGRLPQDYLDTLARHAARSPLADSNFLKKTFLEGCKNAGAF